MMDPIAFLRTVHPEGPWGLFAVRDDEKSHVYRTFDPTDHEAALAWIEDHNERKHNIYWSVGRHGPGLTKKVRTSDILSTHWLHVDIDPRADESPDAERERIRCLLLEQCPTPPPSLVVFSGGGYQAFWRLREPYVFGDYEEIAQRNKRLSVELEGDATHDVARVMRVAGTVNWPHDKKRKRGQKKTTAEVAHYDPELLYSIEDFARADKATTPVVRPIVRGERIEDVDELDAWGVSDRCKVAIVQGKDWDTPLQGDNSDSGWVWFVTCHLIRQGVRDERILAILTDDSLAISTHIRKNRDPDNYARHTIARAHDEVARTAEDFARQKNGKPQPTAGNIRLAIRKLGPSLAYDEFADRETIDAALLDDARTNRLRLACEELFGFLPPKDLFYDVAADECRANAHHPVREYLDGLAWDGQRRIDSWLIDYAGAEDSEYVRAVAAIVLVAAVRRVRQPGVKFDEMLVLESPQGWEKSSALAALAVREEWFDDSLRLGADIEKQMEATSGRWIVEAAELEGLGGNNVEKLKSYLSRRVDRARLAYGRKATERPRQFVVIGTTNSDRYLRDSTGNRRFWPVRVGRVDLEALHRDRDQLWAEAAVREREGMSIRLPKRLWAAAAEEQSRRYQADPFEDALRDCFGDAQGKVAAADVWSALGIPAGLRTKAHEARVGEAMRALGFERKKLRYRPGSPPCWGYVRGNPHLTIEVVGGEAVPQEEGRFF